MTNADDIGDLTDSLQTHAVELGPDPNADHADFGAFSDALAGVSVVGLGEATHRTREFARFKHRFVRYLVEDHGFRAVALEAPFSEAVALDDYVTHGRRDLEGVLDDVGFRIYQVEEAAAFVEWLRAFNVDRSSADRVRVYGVDVQSAAGAARALRDWIRERDAEVAGDAMRTLDAAAEGVFEDGDVNGERLRAAENAADALDGELHGDPADDLVERHLRTLRQACEFYRADGDRATQWGLRDEYMAENVAWVREHVPGDRVAVWAHDNHVKRGRLVGAPAAATMGERLARRYGDAYYALGAQFAGGTVRAFVPVDGDGDVEHDGRAYAMTTLGVPGPGPESAPDLFGRADASAFLLDYRSLPGESPLRAWLDAERPHRYVAGVVDPDDESPFECRHHALRAFDGVYFVRAATPTTPL